METKPKAETAISAAASWIRRALAREGVDEPRYPKKAARVFTGVGGRARNALATRPCQRGGSGHIGSFVLIAVCLSATAFALSGCAGIRCSLAGTIGYECPDQGGGAIKGSDAGENGHSAENFAHIVQSGGPDAVADGICEPYAGDRHVPVPSGLAPTCATDHPSCCGALGTASNRPDGRAHGDRHEIRSVPRLRGRTWYAAARQSAEIEMHGSAPAHADRTG